MNSKDRIIDSCIESQAMRNHLKTQDISDYHLTEMIAGSPLSLREKLDLYPLIDEEYAIKFYEETKKAIDNLQLKSGEIFCLTECWYDDDILDEKNSFAEPFTTFGAVLKYVREYMRDEEWDDETETWSYIEKFVPDKSGIMKNTYTYYLIKDKVVYFERGRYGDTFDGYVSSMSLNLPIPFEVGDIVVLNCLPFAPVKVALLTEVKNCDCCGVQMLYHDTDGEWKTGALKHGHGWGSYYPLLSPIYRLKKLELKARETSKLLKADEEGLLRELQKSLRKDIRNE